MTHLTCEIAGIYSTNSFVHNNRLLFHSLSAAFSDFKHTFKDDIKRIAGKPFTKHSSISMSYKLCIIS